MMELDSQKKKIFRDRDHQFGDRNIGLVRGSLHHQAKQLSMLKPRHVPAL